MRALPWMVLSGFLVGEVLSFILRDPWYMVLGIPFGVYVAVGVAMGHPD